MLLKFSNGLKNFMYDSLVFYTFILLILFFSGLEYYKFKLCKIGKIIEVCQSEHGLEHLIRTRFKVELPNGQIVEAEAERCTMCTGQFKVGDEVNILKSKNNRFFIHLPLLSFKNRSCNTTRHLSRET